MARVSTAAADRPVRLEPRPDGAPGPVLNRSDVIVLGLSLLAVVAAALTHYLHVGGTILPFVASAAAVALLASVVGRSVEQLGDRFGPGATGVLQSALGNLPELFIALFALKAGLVGVVQGALIGSILANLLLVTGLSFVVGGLRHGPQNLNSERARNVVVMMVLSVAAMIIPSLAAFVHAPAGSHQTALSVIASVALLALFAVTLPASLRKQQDEPTATGLGQVQHRAAARETESEAPRWPVWLAVGLLALSAVAAAFVSDWFVVALEPAMEALHISEAFAGLVVVAIAGNAIENVVGIQLAAAGRSEYAFSVILNSPMQIALVLAPALVLLSTALGFTPLTLVFPPMLILALVVAVVLTAFITFDGVSTWAEGAAMLVLYVIIATSFWWG